MTFRSMRRINRRDGASRRQLMVAAFALLAGESIFLDAAAQSKADGAREITWDDLWPEGEDERVEELFNTYLAAIGKAAPDGIAEGSALDQMPQIGTFTTVENLNGKRIRIPGYIVPIDFSATKQYASFLLVPYFGACIHTPPPPPNQIIHVKASPAATIKDMWSPVWAEGVLLTTRTDSQLADAAYTMNLTRIEPYGR